MSVSGSNHRALTTTTSSGDAAGNALRVYDRFASSAQQSFLPPTSDRKSRRSPVLGTWPSFNSSLAPKDKLAEDSAREDVLSVKSIKSSKGHRHEGGDLTRPYLSPVAAPKGSNISLDNLVAAGLTGTAIHAPRRDKASQVLGIPHRSSMEPIPARKRTSIVSTRSAQNAPPSPSFTPTMPLASLYVVSGLPKRPQTWTLADPDAVQGLTHTDGAVGKWWRAEVLGSTVSPGVGGGKKKKVMKGHSTQMEVSKGPGALSKQETAKMLSKTLKVRISASPRRVMLLAERLFFAC